MRQTEKDNRDAALQQISPMQKKILDMLILDGLSYKQIALRLKRNPNTIKHHCKRIRKKVGVNSMYQVVAVAVDLGWVLAPEVKG